MVSLFLQLNTFHRFILADISFSFGHSIVFVGSNWYLFSLTKSDSTVGMNIILHIIGGALLFRVVGAIIDKNDRYRIMFHCVIFRFFLTILTIILLLVFSKNGMYWIFAYSFVNGLIWMMYQATSRAYLQEILFTRLFESNATREVSIQCSVFSAAGISGMVYQSSGLNGILLVNSMALIVGILILASIDPVRATSIDKSSKKNDSIQTNYSWNVIEINYT